MKEILIWREFHEKDKVTLRAFSWVLRQRIKILLTKVEGFSQFVIEQFNRLLVKVTILA
jgi:hypothetical protein